MRDRYGRFRGTHARGWSGDGLWRQRLTRLHDARYHNTASLPAKPATAGSDCDDDYGYEAVYEDYVGHEQDSDDA